MAYYAFFICPIWTLHTLIALFNWDNGRQYSSSFIAWLIGRNFQYIIPLHSHKIDNLTFAGEDLPLKQICRAEIYASAFACSLLCCTWSGFHFHLPSNPKMNRPWCVSALNYKSLCAPADSNLQSWGTHISSYKMYPIPFKWWFAVNLPIFRVSPNSSEEILGLVLIMIRITSLLTSEDRPFRCWSFASNSPLWTLANHRLAVIIVPLPNTLHI